MLLAEPGVRELPEDSARVTAPGAVQPASADVYLDLEPNSDPDRVAYVQALHGRGVAIVPLLETAIGATEVASVCSSATVVLVPTRSVADAIPDIPSVVLPDFTPLLPEASRDRPLVGRYILSEVDRSDPAAAAIAIAAFSRMRRGVPGINLVLTGAPPAAAEALQGVRVVEDPDPVTLAELYANADLVVAVGHADPSSAIRGLASGRVVIASLGGAAAEIVGGYADFVHFGTPSEVAETALAYLMDQDLREQRESQVRNGFRADGGVLAVRGILAILANLDTAGEIIAAPHAESLQWVFISNVPESLRANIALIDERVSWVKEYVVIAPEAMRAQIEAIPTSTPIQVVGEESVLGSRLEAFRASDHQRKNWMLRSLLATLATIDDEFIMLDDDNQPLREIPVELFIGDGPRYFGYYFYDLARWPHRITDFDFGAKATRDAMRETGLESLAYSSHQPQVINKRLFGEVVRAMDIAAPGRSIDEWSSYFNYVASRYPTILGKRVFRTLNWPATPSAWAHLVHPESYYFENFYPGESTHHNESEPSRAAAKHLEEEPFERSVALYEAADPYVRELELTHGGMVFGFGSTSLVVSGVPHVITVGAAAPVRLRLSFALLDRGVERTTRENVQFCYRLTNLDISHGVNLENTRFPDAGVGNGIFEIAFPIVPLEPGVYDLDFFAQIDGQGIFREGVSYRSRLVVCSPDDSVPSAFLKL